MISNSLAAVTWFVLSLVISVFNDALSKVLCESISASTVVLWRLIFSVIVLLPIVLKFGASSIKTTKTHLHILRGFILSAAMSLWCYGMKFVPITTVTLMSFTIPIFTVVMACLLLREKIYINTIIKTFVGFTGSILTLSPQGVTFSLPSGIFILASILFATLDVLNKKLLNDGEKTLPMIFYSNLFSAIFILFFPGVMKNSVGINLSQLLFLLGLGIGANLVLFCIIKAFSKATASFLAPFRYLELIMSTFLGFLFFNETISRNTLVGGSLILLSSVIINKKKIKVKTTAEERV